jgi:O-antigen biosynthesis protein WbqP
VQYAFDCVRRPDGFDRSGGKAHIQGASTVLVGPSGPVESHLPDAYLTPIGGFLRRSSLDELPQLFSVLNGDLSLVGPRPALFNQNDLIALRTESGVHNLVPGITGWAQVNGRDELPIPEKVRLDCEYLRTRSFWLDIKILFLTIVKVARREGVSH